MSFDERVVIEGKKIEKAHTSSPKKYIDSEL